MVQRGGGGKWEFYRRRSPGISILLLFLLLLLLHPRTRGVRVGVGVGSARRPARLLRRAVEMELLVRAPLAEILHHRREPVPAALGEADPDPPLEDRRDRGVE